jgi:radical SAM superfamily enzyme YgiQ (UPF0313 family)
MNSVDVIFCSLPALFVDRLPAAPALLKATAEDAGYSASSVDLNLEFFINQANQNTDNYNQLSLIFTPNSAATKESSEAMTQWVQDSVQYIKKVNPKIIGLSVFTVFQHRAAVALSIALRGAMPESKIIMGGYGLNVNSNGLQTSSLIKKFDLLKPFWQLAKEKNLADEVFLGTALEDLVNYLQRTLGGSNNFREKYQKEKPVLFNTPVPNYDDYKLDKYVWNDGPALPITGSRGCVRDCTFCDVGGQFGKFTFRTGKDIANEIIELSQRYNVNTFDFTDSLVNGSLKSFQEWLRPIAGYNDSVETYKKIKWYGQYICRPQTEVSNTIYDLIVRSGCVNLTIGVESGSNEVLKAMNKNMTTEDVLAELEQFKIHGIQGQLLMLSGFYNETPERYNETLKFIVKLQHYIASGAVSAISMGPPLYINELMPLHHLAEEVGVILDPTDTKNWSIEGDPSNTLVERYYRRLVAQLVLDKLGVPMNGNSILNMFQSKLSLEKMKNQIINV